MSAADMEALAQRVRGYVVEHEGMCWCGFEDLSDNNTLDHIVHRLLDDWPGLVAAVRAETLAEAEQAIRDDLIYSEDGSLLNTFNIGEEYAARIVHGMAGSDPR